MDVLIANEKDPSRKAKLLQALNNPNATPAVQNAQK
jgi:hypothetical protein